MIYKIKIFKDNYTTTFPSGRSVTTKSLLKVIKTFNTKCPVMGGILDRDHPQVMGNPTHRTLKLWLDDHHLNADIEILATDRPELSNMQIKPIIVTPLQFGSGVTEISEIRLVQLATS